MNKQTAKTPGVRPARKQPAATKGRKTPARSKSAPARTVPAEIRAAKIPPATNSAVSPRSYWQKNWYYLAGFVLALLIFGVCAWFVHYDIGLGKEQALLRFVNQWPEGFGVAFVALTALGSIWTAALAVTGAFVLRLYQLAWRMALSVLASYGLLIILKDFFARPRPGEGLLDLNVRITEIGFGFPSAHTATATVIALVLLPYLPRGWRWVIVAFLIGAVSLSRMYLGVHAPFDIIAGFAVGAGVVCFWRILPRFVKKIVRLK